MSCVAEIRENVFHLNLLTCGAPNVNRHPVAVDCIWKLSRLLLWWKLLLTEKGPHPTLAEPAFDCALKCFSTCWVSPWNCMVSVLAMPWGKEGEKKGSAPRWWCQLRRRRMSGRPETCCNVRARRWLLGRRYRCRLIERPSRLSTAVDQD